MSTPRTPNNNAPHRLSPTRSVVKKLSEKVAPYATLLGLLNDIIGILSIIFSLFAISSTLLVFNAESEPLSTKILITVYHLLALWVVTVYLFYGLTRRLYIKLPEPRPTYGDFFLRENILGFKSPMISVTSLLLLILLIWLISYMEPAIISALVSLLALGIVAGFIYYKEYYNSRENIEWRNFAHLVNKDWALCEKVIEERLAQHMVLRLGYLRDLTETYNVSLDRVDYIYSKYASMYPDKVFFGYLYTKDGQPVHTRRINRYNNNTVPEKVLIAVKHLKSLGEKYDFR